MRTWLTSRSAIACGLARMAIVAEVLGTPLFTVTSVAGELDTDFMGIVSRLLFWAMVELGVAMVAICLPTFGPLLKDLAPENAMKSVRSWISLVPLTGSGSRTRQTSSKPRDIPGDSSEIDAAEKRTVRKWV